MNLDFLQWLVVGLLGALFFKEEMKGYISSKLGKDPETPAMKTDRLARYYNHDLTDKLDQILKAEEEEHMANDRTREVLASVDSLLREFKEYGIKIRK